MKTCNKCKVPQPLSEFRCSRAPGVCRECQRTQRRHAYWLRTQGTVQEKPVLTLKERKMSGESWLALEALLPELRRFSSWLGQQMYAEKYFMDMQDVLQESIVKMLTSTTQPPVEELKHWALRIIRNTALNEVATYRSSPLLDVHYSLPASEGKDWFRELEDQLPLAIALLPHKQQEYMQGRASGLTYDHIAKVSNISIGCVKGVAHTGKKNLRKLLTNLV